MFPPLTRAAFILLALTLFACDRRPVADATPTTQTTAEPPKPTEARLSRDAIEANHVEIGVIGKRVLIPTFPAAARVAFNSEAMAHVGAPVAGRVAELKVHLGDTVKATNELLIVESPDMGEAQSDYLQKKTTLAAATAAVEPTRINYERGKSLYEQSQSISLAEVQKREAEFKAAQAVMQAAAGAVTGARNKLSLIGMSPDAVQTLEKTGVLTPRYSIRTPIDGQVIQCDLTQGALVGPDKELTLEIADMNKLWVLADVAEAHYAQLKKDAPATVTVPALPGQSFPGKVTLLAAALDPATRTLQCRIEIDNAKHLLRPGMLATADIQAADAKPDLILALPDEAIQPIDDDLVVFIPVEGSDGKFKRIDVKTGPSVSGWTPILSGLTENQKVVTRGAFIIKAQLAKPPEEKD